MPGLQSGSVAPVNDVASVLEMKRFGLLAALLMAPIVIPAIILGIGLLMLYTRFFVHTLGIAVNGTVMGLLIGHAVVCLPWVVRVLIAGLQSMERDVEEAAMNLGARPLDVLWHVTLPLLRPALLLLCSGRGRSRPVTTAQQAMLHPRPKTVADPTCVDGAQRLNFASSFWLFVMSSQRHHRSHERRCSRDPATPVVFLRKNQRA